MGGIWLIWNDQKVRVQILRGARVSAIFDKFNSLMIFVYSRPWHMEREELRLGLEDLSGNIKGPWMVSYEQVYGVFKYL